MENTAKVTWTTLKKNILVIGGAGYLGSVLCTKLLDLGHNVTILDNFVFGEEPISHLKEKTNLQIINSDIRDFRTLSIYIEKNDIVICLSALVGFQLCEINPPSTIEINNLSIKVIADLCNLYNKKLIFSSTCSVYGSSGQKLITEKDKEVIPTDLYGETKYFSEKYIKENLKDYLIFRFGTIFGLSYRMRFDLVVNLFIGRALEGEELILHGGGIQMRPHVHISDACDGIIHGINKDLKGIYNVVYQNYSIKEIGEMISKELNVPMRVTEEIIDKRDYNVSNKKLGLSGFEPKKDILFAIQEISKVYPELGSYKQDKFNNYNWVKNNTEVQKKLFMKEVKHQGKEVLYK